ncbi:MAG: hypothetical protein ACLSAF_03675 [Intestinimonas sp.]
MVANDSQAAQAALTAWRNRHAERRSLALLPLHAIPASPAVHPSEAAPHGAQPGQGERPGGKGSTSSCRSTTAPDTVTMSR